MVAEEPADLRTGRPHPARIYDYLLGGKENYPADRLAAEEIGRGWAGLRDSMRANRRFMRRVVRHLAVEEGIRQFLDVGTGLPTPPNLHEVAQGAAPESRVVYVDNDPVVLVHARALLTSGRPEGRVACLDADVRDPEAILSAPELRDTLDLDRPVALSLIAILQYVVDDGVAKRVIDRLMEPLPAGSVLALSAVTADSAPEQVARGVAAFSTCGIPLKARNKAEVEGLFDGLDLLPPGVVLVHHWRPDDDAAVESDAHVHLYGGVARKV
ncbi:SAM-dependent methyltransferase [Actinomadura rugatobispora]|uniref:SAM-dependent methyltransferase n=1 Tax=Actinomadura rugatobispora TaxID=1994 RepID=A0ABW1AJP8_9ACTN|nr:SAM-dependent methyltransferase [Actinomadura rugatobispora]